MTQFGHDPGTLAFYAREAAAYAARPRGQDRAALNAFLARLSPRARVLDMGCGGGQDTLAIAQAGFRVTAMDGTPELAAEARLRTGQTVRVQLFEDLDDVEAYDAVWANASLLHVSKPALPDIFALVHRALTPAGLIYASFKSGGVEGRDALGRYYNHPNKDELIAALPRRAWDERVVLTGKGAGYDGVVTDWLLVTARKAGPLAKQDLSG